METIDELVTPGCPNCVVKHLSAAVMYMAEARCESFTCRVPKHAVMAARAHINLVESMQGYRSHFDFAVGLLARAEERAIHDSAIRDKNIRIAAMYRNVRLGLIQNGPGGTVNAMWHLDLALADSCTEPEMIFEILAFAHAEEAYRESPQGFYADELRKCTAHMTVQGLQNMIAQVRKDFFDFDQGEKPAEEKGEEHMATAKKAPAKAAAKKAAPVKADAKKVPAKAATKAACKGGKTKKGK